MQERAHVRWIDACTCLAFFATTLVLCRHLSTGRLFWSDEIFGWMLVRDPSLRHMLFAWRAGADGGGIVFYLLARGWLHVFGASELTFRLFSATGAGVAASISFLLLRRFVRWRIAAPVIALLWFSSDVVLWQMMQARFYGLLLAAAAAVTLLYVLGISLPRPSLVILLGTFLAHTLLVGTHPFGVVYSAALICAMLWAAFRRSSPPSLAIAAIAGWWILLPSLAALRSTAAVGRPHFWTTRPTAADRLATYTCWSLLVALALGFGLTAVLALHVIGSRPHARMRGMKNRAVVVAAGLLLAIPAVVWLGSLGRSSIFVDRYLVPVVIPIALLLAWIGHRLDHAAAKPLPRALLGVATSSLLLWTAAIAWVQYPAYASYPGPDNTTAIVQLLPSGMPVVVEPVDLFDQLVLYRNSSGTPFLTVLDWQEATGPDALRGEVTAFHEMENWRRVGYFADSIVDNKTLLQWQKPFAVIDVEPLHWFEHRIEHNPVFTTQLYRQLREPDYSSVRVWIVRPAPPASRQ